MSACVRSEYNGFPLQATDMQVFGDSNFPTATNVSVKVNSVNCQPGSIPPLAQCLLGYVPDPVDLRRL